MVKKIIVIVAFLALLGFSFMLVSKTQNQYSDTVEEEDVADSGEELKLPDTVFTFTSAELSPDCTSDDVMFCTVETAVKCTLNPDFAPCAKADLPKFIFMRDSSLDRPTEISYKIIDKKTLPNDTFGIYTESNCNGTWFGLCQNTIVYVLAPKAENSWFVKEIYAIE